MLIYWISLKTGYSTYLVWLLATPSIISPVPYFSPSVHARAHPLPIYWYPLCCQIFCQPGGPTPYFMVIFSFHLNFLKLHTWTFWISPPSVTWWISPPTYCRWDSTKWPHLLHLIYPLKWIPNIGVPPPLSSRHLSIFLQWHGAHDVLVQLIRLNAVPLGLQKVSCLSQLWHHLICFHKLRLSWDICVQFLFVGLIIQCNIPHWHHSPCVTSHVAMYVQTIHPPFDQFGILHLYHQKFLRYPL